MRHPFTTGKGSDTILGYGSLGGYDDEIIEKKDRKATGSIGGCYPFDNFIKYHNFCSSGDYAGAKVNTPAPTATAASAGSNAGRSTSKDASAYYAKSVFVGDSVLAGYRNYLAKEKSSPVSSSTFLAAASYSAAHALKENDSLHPIYRGKKQPVWAAISQMDVDRVFIMFGTNDLVVKDAGPASEDVLALVEL